MYFFHTCLHKQQTPILWLTVLAMYTVHGSFMTTGVSQPAEDRKQLLFSHFLLCKQGPCTVQQQPAHPHLLTIFSRASRWLCNDKAVVLQRKKKQKNKQTSHTFLTSPQDLKKTLLLPSLQKIRGAKWKSIYFCTKLNWPSAHSSHFSAEWVQLSPFPLSYATELCHMSKYFPSLLFKWSISPCGCEQQLLECCKCGSQLCHMHACISLWQTFTPICQSREQDEDAGAVRVSACTECVCLHWSA